MGIFDRIKKSAPADEKPKKAKAAPKASEDKKEKEVVAKKLVVKSSANLLVAPRISEKAAILASKGTYVFNVPTSANKIEVRKAVEALYSVHVTDVRMVRGKGKAVSRGRIGGVRNDWKKALVTLKDGEKLDLYEGV